MQIIFLPRARQLDRKLANQRVRFGTPGGTSFRRDRFELDFRNWEATKVRHGILKMVIGEDLSFLFWCAVSSWPPTIWWKFFSTLTATVRAKGHRKGTHGQWIAFVSMYSPLIGQVRSAAPWFDRSFDRVYRFSSNLGITELSAAASPLDVGVVLWDQPKVEYCHSVGSLNNTELARVCRSRSSTSATSIERNRPTRPWNLKKEKEKYRSEPHFFCAHAQRAAPMNESGHTVRSTSRRRKQKKTLAVAWLMALRRLGFGMFPGNSMAAVVWNRGLAVEGVGHLEGRKDEVFGGLWGPSL